MKTAAKLSFPKLQNEYIKNILRQLVSQHSIVQVFFTGEPSPLFSQLIIHTEKNTSAQELRQSKWVAKVKTQYQINVCFIYSSKLHRQYALGAPFTAFYCRPAAVIYQNEALEEAVFSTGEWKKYKKKLNAYQNNFYHDHELQKWQIKNLMAEGASNSVFTSYARLLEYNIECLEKLYTGNTCNTLSLDERIRNLTACIPEIQKYFVQTNRNQYFLTALFEKAKQAASEGDEIYKDEMYQAVEITEQNLLRLITERFAELKKRIKKESSKKQNLPGQIDNKPKDSILDTAIESILNSVEVEQIYAFHQIIWGEKTTYYLLLIADTVGNEKVRALTHSLKSKLGDQYDFVLLSHSRYWIQKNLYLYQHFFSRTIQNQNLIWSSAPYHPDLHWEVPFEPSHADLYFYYKAAKNVAFQFFAIANNPKQNYQGLDYLFALFFLSFCRTYIFVKTYYLPNYLSAQSLWQLCSYADSNIRKHHYLLEQFPTDVFSYIDKHMILHHRLSKLDKEQVVQMNLIVEKLIFELHHLVIEGKLIYSDKDEEEE
ncbi:hypothetical protein [Flavobacterium pectinovorum]|uniref:hypothetical protein n=1 Tax=Flavobacterium pectinovorum TaxID=29533 RepID=UPI001FAE0933|nr:hypothetical protein [Flavobacterium pectinovorum]MCI9845054.1 hypothetical protein [Flavobacterium pectinovorum]